MRLAWEFLKRDVLIAISYRTAFVTQLGGNIVVLAVFYFIGKLFAGTLQNFPGSDVLTRMLADIIRAGDKILQCSSEQVSFDEVFCSLIESENTREEV